MRKSRQGGPLALSWENLHSSPRVQRPYTRGCTDENDKERGRTIEEKKVQKQTKKKSKQGAQESTTLPACKAVPAKTSSDLEEISAHLLDVRESALCSASASSEFEVATAAVIGALESAGAAAAVRGSAVRGSAEGRVVHLRVHRREARSVLRGARRSHRAL